MNIFLCCDSVLNFVDDQLNLIHILCFYRKPFGRVFLPMNSELEVLLFTSNQKETLQQALERLGIIRNSAQITKAKTIPLLNGSTLRAFKLSDTEGRAMESTYSCTFNRIFSKLFLINGEIAPVDDMFKTNINKGAITATVAGAFTVGGLTYGIRRYRDKLKSKTTELIENQKALESQRKELESKQTELKTTHVTHEQELKQVLERQEKLTELQLELETETGKSKKLAQEKIEEAKSADNKYYGVYSTLQKEQEKALKLTKELEKSKRNVTELETMVQKHTPQSKFSSTYLNWRTPQTGPSQSASSDDSVEL